METLSDEFTSQRQLAIVERFEGFINYLYPIALNVRRVHHIVRDRLIAAMFEQVNLFCQAGKRYSCGHLQFKQHLAANLKMLSVALLDELSLSRFVASWKGHAQWANSFNLINKLGVA